MILQGQQIRYLKDLLYNRIEYLEKEIPKTSLKNYKQDMKDEKEIYQNILNMIYEDESTIEMQLET